MLDTPLLIFCVILSIYEKNHLLFLLVWLGKKLLGVSGLFCRQMIVLQKDVILWLAFTGARPIFQEIEDVQFCRSFTLEDVNCNFHGIVDYYFLDGISLAST